MKRTIFVTIALTILLSVASSSFAAPGGEPGRPASPGRPFFAGDQGGFRSVPSAPEPVSIALFVLGGAGLVAYKSRKK